MMCPYISYGHCIMTLQRFPSSKPFPFSDMVKANGFLFLSGQVSMTQNGEPLPGSISEQTQRILDSIEQTLALAGATLNDIVRAQVWLSDMDNFAEFNTAWRNRFSNGFPSRSVVTSRLAFGLDVEIEVQAIEPCLTS